MHISESTTWKYAATETENWYTPSFDASSWSSAVAGSFPAFTGTDVNRYYRTTLTVPSDVSGFVAFELGVYTEFDYELYFNGEQVLSGEAITGAVYNRISFPIHKLPSDSVVIAVAIHDATDADLFKGFFHFITPTSNRVFDGSCNSNHPADVSTEGMAMAFDNNRNTKWYASSLPAYDTYIYESGREFINAYSITSTGGQAVRRPTAWTVSGSNDGTAWTVVDQRSAIHFTNMYQTLKFALPHQSESYSQYKIEFTAVESGTALEIAIIQFLIDDVAYASTPVLSYPSTVELFVGQTDIAILPNAGFQSFQISPSLPAGLSFSTESGTISGSPATAAASASYEVTATHVSTGTTSYTATISLAVVACGTDKTRVDIVKKDAGLGTADQWILKSGETVIDSHIGRDIMGSQIAGEESFAYCLTPGKYSLTLSQKFGKGWHNAAYIDVRVYLDSTETMNVLHYTLLPGEKEATIDFNTAVLSNNDMTSWNYKADGTVPSNWNAVSFSDTWSTIPATRPSVAQSVWLLRRAVTVSSITGFMGFELRVYARAGVVVYLNGNEYFRTNVVGDVTASSTASVTSSTPSWKYFYGRVGTGHLIAGQNTFAIAIVNSDSTSTSMDVKVSLRLTTMNSMSLGLDTTVTDTAHESTATVGANLFHGDYSTRFKAVWSSEDIVITAAFNGGVYANMYCLVASWNAPDNYPGKWTISTSTDGSTFTEAVTADHNQFSHIYERQCFTFNTPSAALRALRFTVKAPSVAEAVNIQLDAIDLYFVDPSQVTIPTFTYEGTPITVYAGADVVITPTTSYYHGFTVSPDLPAGLVLLDNGTIRGRVESVMDPVLVTVSGKDFAGNTVTGTLSMLVVSCSDTHSIVRFVTGDTGGTGDRMVVGLTTADQTIYYNDNIADYTLSIDWAWCLPADLYTFTFVMKEGNNWNSGYTIYSGSTTSTGTVNAAATPVRIALSTLQFIHEGTHEYEYVMPSESTPTNYYLKSTTRNWQTATPGNFPIVPKYTSIYCTTFNASRLDLYGTVVIGVKVKGGFIMYLNDQEINRVNLGASATFNSPATDSFTTDTFVEYIDSAQLSLIQDGENFICVEVHKKTASAEAENTFDMYIRPLAGGRDIIADGEASASHPGYYDGYYDERYPNLFDKITNNKWFSNDYACSNQYGQYTFNNKRREYANYLVLYQANNNGRNPHTVKVLGSNTPDDENSWSILTSGSVSYPGAGYGYYTTFSFYPSKPYNSYRILLNGCNGEGIELSEIVLYSNAIEGAFCRPSNGIPGALENGISEGPCPDGYTGSISYRCTAGEFVEEARQCIPAAPKDLAYPEDTYDLMTKESYEIVPTFVGFDVTFTSLPSMPSGLTLNPSTGVISGTPTAEQIATRYMILCKNDGGNDQVDIKISVTAKPIPVWVYIVIALVVVLIIAAVVVIVIVSLKKKKTAKKKPSSKKTLPKTVQPKPKDTGAKVAV